MGLLYLRRSASITDAVLRAANCLCYYQLLREQRSTVMPANAAEIARLGVDVLPRLVRAVVVLAGQSDDGATVGIAQFRILKRLAQRPWLVSELAHTLKLSVPTVSVAVDSLVRRGLVEKTEAAHDRRATVLRLTEAGLRSNEAFQERAVSALRQVVDRLSAEDQAALAAGLSAVGIVLDNATSRVGSLPRVDAKG